jgi:hypothetical protein
MEDRFPTSSMSLKDAEAAAAAAAAADAAARMKRKINRIYAEA